MVSIIAVYISPSFCVETSVVSKWIRGINFWHQIESVLATIFWPDGAPQHATPPNVFWDIWHENVFQKSLKWGVGRKKCSQSVTIQMSHTHQATANHHHVLYYGWHVVKIVFSKSKLAPIPSSKCFKSLMLCNRSRSAPSSPHPPHCWPRRIIISSLNLGGKPWTPDSSFSTINPFIRPHFWSWSYWKFL